MMGSSFVFSDNKLTHRAAQPHNDDAFFKLMLRNLSRQSLEKGITWRDDREWLNAVLRDGEKNDGDHYMLMLGHTPYNDYAVFQHVPSPPLPALPSPREMRLRERREKKRKKSFGVSEEMRDFAFSTRYASLTLGRNNFPLRAPPFCNARLVSNEARDRYGMKCGSYLGANEDKYFNWPVKL